MEMSKEKMIDKTKILFIISTIIVATALAVYPNISIYKQDDIITKIDKLNENRTQQYTTLLNLSIENQRLGLINQNLTLQNQELIKQNQEYIKNITTTNLNLTKHNKAVLDETNILVGFLNDNFGNGSGYIQKEDIQHNQTNEIYQILKHLNITHPK